MAGRPPNPISVRGGAYVWGRGAENLLQAHRDDFPQYGAAALAEHKLSVTLEGVHVRMLGVVLGTSAGEEIDVHVLEQPELGFPLFRAFAVVAEARLPGIPAEAGLLAENTRERKWAVAFGDDALDEWIYRLGLPRPIRRVAATALFTRRINYATIRKQIWEGRKSAEAQWRSR